MVVRGRKIPSNRVKLLAAADLSFRGNYIYAVVAIFSFPKLELIEVKRAKCRMTFPYVPGLLTFREGPCLLKAFKKITNDPDVIIFDGQGIAHPAQMGVATHMGILLNKPSIGCAKSRLVGEYREPGRKKGSTSPLYYNERVVGAVLRSRDEVKPLFISPGHKIDVKSSIKIVLACCRGYRNSEPIRYVDGESKKLARQFRPS
jgi:deoxyribonuclease V